MTISGLYEHASTEQFQTICPNSTNNGDRGGEILIQCSKNRELFTTMKSIHGRRVDSGLLQLEPIVLPDQAHENVADRLDQYINNISSTYDDEYSDTIRFTRRHISRLLEGPEVGVS